MKSKFNQIYEKIILENKNCKYFEDLKKYQVCSKYSPYLHLPYIFSIQKNLINEVKSLYNYRQIYSYKNNYLIDETPINIAQYGNNILDFIDTNQNIILDKNKFLQYIPNTWQYYKKFLNSENIQLYIFKFDFENSETENFSLVNDVLKNFYTDQQLGIFANNKELHAKEFTKQNIFSSGGTMPVIYSNVLHKKICLMYLNTNLNNLYNKTTINHELFHYMQEILYIDLLKDTDAAPSCTDLTIQNYLNYLNLSPIYYNQYFNRHEFWTYIHVNLTNFFEEFFKIMQNNNNKQLKQNLMINKILYEIEATDVDKIFTNKLLSLIFKIMKNNETNMLKFLILIAKIYPDTLFIEVKNILIKYFK